MLIQLGVTFQRSMYNVTSAVIQALRTALLYPLDDPNPRHRMANRQFFEAQMDRFLRPEARNITLGDRVFFNFNCVILDVAPVVIGSGVLFGPAVQIYAATHPLSAAKRRVGLELGLPITIEDDVWVGGGAIICPGVSVGAASVIGAGAVVTKDIPPGVVAAGNPCRIVREVED
jgi:acetyltransferase-like isoleucine patch superfamily enzyme